jgi:uncharacterized protein
VRNGNWFLSLKGRQLYPFDLRPEDIDIDEIAVALGNMCRFGCHLHHFYSVAQHSVYVSRIVPHNFKRIGLLHDATEAYIGDMIRPLKQSPELQAFREIEENVWVVIAERFGLPRVIPQEVEEADNRVLMTERRDLLPPHPWEWGPAQSRHPAQPYDFRITTPLQPRAAAAWFLSECKECGL